MTDTVVATANVLGTLRRGDACAAVAGVLDHGPDLVGLQEWYPVRWGLLRRFPAYRWWQPLLGGCAVGARRDRFAPVSHRLRKLSPLGRADRDGRPWGVEPSRLATIAVYDDLRDAGTVALVDYHLVSGVQAGDRYRSDRPALVARHRRETAALQRVVREALAEGHRVFAVGDSNFHGFRLPGLISTWEGWAGTGGTLGPRRQVDDVHSLTSPIAVELVTTPSDHRAVVVRA